MEESDYLARPPTPQVLIHRLPDRPATAGDESRKPSKYIILVTAPITTPGKVQITHSVARALSCPSYLGDSVHSSSAKAAGVGATPAVGPNEARYQRMWLSKMTRTGLLFPEESRPATEGFHGFPDTTPSTASSRRGSTSSVSSTVSNAVPLSGSSSNKEEFLPTHLAAEAPSAGSNKVFTMSETERLRRANPVLMVLAHPELEPWHKIAIRKALGDYRIGIIFVPLYEEDDDTGSEGDLPVLRPLDPALMTSFSASPRFSHGRTRGWGNLDEEMKVRVTEEADVDEKIQEIINGIGNVIGIDDE